MTMTTRRRSPADKLLIRALRAAGVRELSPGLTWSVPRGRTVRWDGARYICDCGRPVYLDEACPHVVAVSDNIRERVAAQQIQTQLQEQTQ